MCKILQCGYMDHGLKHISFYVQKRVVAMGMCCNPVLVRDKPLGAPASVKWVYCDDSVLESRTFCLKSVYLTNAVKSLI